MESSSSFSRGVQDNIMISNLYVYVCNERFSCMFIKFITRGGRLLKVSIKQRN